MSIILSTQSNIANTINKFLNFVKTKLNKLFVTILQQQQRIVLLSNYIENFKLNLFILFKILSFLDFKSTISFELFFNSINFNKFFKTIKLLDTF